MQATRTVGALWRGQACEQSERGGALWRGQAGENAELSHCKVHVYKGFIIKPSYIGLQRVKWSKYLCNNAC